VQPDLLLACISSCVLAIAVDLRARNMESGFRVQHEKDRGSSTGVKSWMRRVDCGVCSTGSDQTQIKSQRVVQSERTQQILTDEGVRGSRYSNTQ